MKPAEIIVIPPKLGGSCEALNDYYRAVMDRRKYQPVVHVPNELESSDYVGEVWGYYHSSTNEYNVVGWGSFVDQRWMKGEDCFQHRQNRLLILGYVVNSMNEFKQYFKTWDAFSYPKPIFVTWNDSDRPKRWERGLLGIRTNNALVFQVRDRVCRKELYQPVLNVFSRNAGILETDVMLNKRAIISGCGSVGSLVAIELAKAGVGHFMLIDNDTVSYHNLCRHQCGIQDVGKFKVDVVADRILEINSSVQVERCPVILERVRKETFDMFCGKGGCDIIIGCADNRDGDIYGSRISCLYKIPFISIGFWERAFAGEIFYSIPGEMPCYACAFGNLGDQAVSGRTSRNRRLYTTENDLAKVNYEPGISADIGFVTLVGVKLAIDLLNRKTPGYTLKVIQHLSQFTLVCNTNDPRFGGEQAEIFAHPLQVTTSIRVNYRESCSLCKLSK